MRDDKICILAADDEKEIRDILKLLLMSEGYDVELACNGKEVIKYASSDIDLFILDVQMPEMTGIMAASKIRQTLDTPIIFLTAYSGETDKIMGFSVGADDYIVKPFSNIELLMRVKAVLRRSIAFESKKESEIKSKALPQNGIVFGDAYLDPDRQMVYRGDETISLTYTEFKILELLVSHKKKIYSLDNIYESIWGDDAVGDSAIMVHIKNIRKKLGDSSRSPRYIKTAWGRGYYIE